MGKLQKKQQAKQKQRKKKKLHTFVKVGLLFAFLGIVVFSAVVFAAGYTVYQETDLSSLADRHEPTIIYDRHGNVFEELSNSRVDYVSISQIPQSMKDAIVAIEDIRFKEHVGVDPIGIARAFVRNVLDGGVSQGGSTITQQLAKNEFFTLEQTIQRKFKEAVVALKIERELSKDEILEKYLNIIYFGEGAWGIQNAAQIYFGKNVEDLELEESALLAALPKAPSHYSPLVDPVKAKQRRDLVLRQMAEHGMITEEARAAAVNKEIVLTDIKRSRTITSSYADHVIAEAIEHTELTEQEILAGGLHIYTQAEASMQQAAEQVYANHEYFPEGDPAALQSGMAIVDSRTGGILALVGQRGEKQNYRGFNYATQTRRQPGSSIKPIVAYAPALMEGYRKNDQIHDVRTDFSGYTPRNYGGRVHGWVTMEQAIVHSYNIPAVAMLQEVGIGKAMELARESGIPLQSEDRTLALALGGMQTGVSPLQMAGAFTMFADAGVWSEPHAIVEIKNSSNVSLYKAKPSEKKLLTPEVAYEMTTMLQKAVNEGTGTNARMSHPVAGKTGTTQLPNIPRFQGIEGTRDAWFVGYTPDVVGAVWLGYTSNDTDEYLSTTGGRYPSQIFKEVMERALADQPVKQFTRPAGYSEPSGPIRYINGKPPVDDEDEKSETGDNNEVEDGNEANDADQDNAEDNASIGNEAEGDPEDDPNQDSDSNSDSNLNEDSDEHGLNDNEASNGDIGNENDEGNSAGDEAGSPDDSDSENNGETEEDAGGADIPGWLDGLFDNEPSDDESNDQEELDESEVEELPTGEQPDDDVINAQDLLDWSE